MNLTKDQKEKLVMAVQAVLGALFIGLSIKNSAKTQSDQMKRSWQRMLSRRENCISWSTSFRKEN